MDIASIKKMTLVERLLAMELLWDSLAHNENELASPDWHQKILSERKKSLNPKKLVPLSEVKKSLSR
ncbi:MAG TPA: addiction module protein [Candidatus Rifleibacterium sp.]|nr:addiction module protein [Candidatus Rifleibacterium sp.]